MQEKELRKRIFDQLDNLEENFEYLVETICSNWATVKMLMLLYYWDNREDLKEK